MGKKTREIVTANIEVIKDLNTTYSDEWPAHYQYWLTAEWVRGIDADTLGPTLKRTSSGIREGPRKGFSS
jgi:bacterioferritin